jgi:hypothetical protein
MTKDASAQRVLVVTGAATVPIEHALELLGAEGTVIRFDSSVPSRFASHFQLANQTDFFDSLPDTPSGSRVDWFVAVYTAPPTDNSAPDKQLNSWVDESFHQALALIEFADLSTAIIMCPFRFPSAAATARKRLSSPDGWRWRICPVRNTHHGGLIETDHKVLLLIRDDLSARFVFPDNRPISLCEILRLLGLPEPNIASSRFLPEELVLSCARSSPGSHGLAHLFHCLTIAEVDTEESEITGVSAAVPQDQLALLPIPNDNQWRQATIEDPDLLCILIAFADGRIPEARELNDNTYLQVIQHNQVECEVGIMYYYERSRAARLRQLRTKVVPSSLRRVVIPACYSSPFAGHSGITRTLFRVQTRFWWPGVVRDARDGASEGQAALDHFESASPLLYKQRQLLVVLNAGRQSFLARRVQATN